MAETATTTTDQTTQTTDKPWSEGWLKSDGTLNSENYARLPEDIRWTGETLSKYKTVDDLVRGTANLLTAVGKKGIIPLPANAPKEAIAERKALLDGINGVPKEAKEYGLKRPDAIPETAWDEKYVGAVAEWAHKHSVGPAALTDLLNNVTAPNVTAQLQSREAQRTQFLAEQNQKFEEQIRLDAIPKEKADALAERAAVALGFNMDDPAQKGLLQYSAVKLAMLRHALATGEDSYVAGEGLKSEGGDSQALAQDAVNNPANPLHTPYWDAQHPQHQMAVEKVTQLFKLATAKLEKAQK